MEEDEIEELIPKKYYTELLQQYIDLSIDARANYVKGLVTGLICMGAISYLIYSIYG